MHSMDSNGANYNSPRHKLILYIAIIYKSPFFIQRHFIIVLHSPRMT